MSFLIAILTLCAIVETCSSSGEVQVCGNSNYYCTVKNQCLPRLYRCVGRGLCLNFNGLEDGCNCDGSYRSCEVYLGRTTLLSSSSWSKKRNVGVSCASFLYNGGRFEHQFVTYRGFTWEFGKSYLTQALDINDPNYKYNRPAERRGIKDITPMGSSSCTYDQVMAFTNDFDYRYCLCTNNCQHFAQGLITWLLSDCTYKGKRQTNETMSEYFTQISQNQCISEGSYVAIAIC